MKKALTHLENARLVTGELRDGKRIYALTADYLVDAIAQATRDESTAAEEAQHLLNYYQREAADKFRPRWWIFSDPVIPWSKLRFIKANADKSSQRKPEVALFPRGAQGVITLAPSGSARPSSWGPSSWQRR